MEILTKAMVELGFDEQAFWKRIQEYQAIADCALDIDSLASRYGIISTKWFLLAIRDEFNEQANQINMGLSREMEMELYHE